MHLARSGAGAGASHYCGVLLHPGQGRKAPHLCGGVDNAVAVVREADIADAILLAEQHLREPQHRA